MVPSCSPADGTKKQLMSLGNKIGVRLQPVLACGKIGDVLKSRELKPRIINQKCDLNVVNAIWNLSGTPTDTYINVLPNTVHQIPQFIGNHIYDLRYTKKKN